MAKMCGAEKALKAILEMKDADAESPTSSASSDMKTDSSENQSSESDIVSADKDFPRVISGPIPRQGRGRLKVR